MGSPPGLFSSAIDFHGSVFHGGARRKVRRSASEPGTEARIWRGLYKQFLAILPPIGRVVGVPGLVIVWNVRVPPGSVITPEHVSAPGCTRRPSRAS